MENVRLRSRAVCARLEGMIEETFFWYDLETSGINPREDRIMQFAGQRTTLSLDPIGEPVNILIRLGDDVLPQPEAILLTGITPQQTLADGVTEAEFLKTFYDEVTKPGTIFVGFNSIRFDDEFMRYLNYRNYYDPYIWQWKEGRSRWDLLDVVRMTRALRPAGLNWPVVQGKPGNRLEMLTKANGIEHSQAHDALADVTASIAIAKLIQVNQPKLFQWLLTMRDKSQVKKLVETDTPFVYTSGKYANETEKTTVVIRLAAHPKKQAALVYDLRADPSEFLGMTPQELADRWRYDREPNALPRLPVKTMQYNRCPAVAPLGVLDVDTRLRLGIDMDMISAHAKTLQNNPYFIDTVMAAIDILDGEQAERHSATGGSAESRLYDGFYDTHDANLLGVVRAADPGELSSELSDSFHDGRLRALLGRYKARNHQGSLTPEERRVWESYRSDTLLGGGERSKLAQFMRRLQELSQSKVGANEHFLLEELQLYAESIMPVFDDGGA